MIKMMDYVGMEMGESGLSSNSMLQERENFDVLTEKMNCRAIVAEREARSSKRDHEGLLLFKEEEETPCREVLPL